MRATKIIVKCDYHYKYLIRDYISTIGEIIHERKDGYTAKINPLAIERKDDYKSDLGRIYRMLEEYSTSIEKIRQTNIATDNPY